jgi:hypothetical protein
VASTSSRCCGFVAQGLAGPRLDSPSAVAERLLCLQAQDYWSGLASVAVRSGLTLAEVQAALDSGAVVFASRNGVPACTILHGGEVVATWRRTKKGVEEAFTPVPLALNREDLPDFGQIRWQSLSK